MNSPHRTGPRRRTNIANENYGFGQQPGQRHTMNPKGSSAAMADTIEGLKTILNMLRKRNDELNQQRLIQGEQIGKCRNALRQIRRAVNLKRAHVHAQEALDEI